MVTSLERLKILKMIQENKITPNEGLQLLEALGEEKGAGTAAGMAINAKGARFLRVRVTDTNTGKQKVNIRLPLGVVNTGIKIGAKFSTQVQGMDEKHLTEMINSGEIGQIVDVMDDEDHEHVEIFLE
jgi:hypothetical protein